MASTSWRRGVAARQPSRHHLQSHVAAVEDGRQRVVAQLQLLDVRGGGDDGTVGASRLEGEDTRVTF